jgi:hypothetical protein
MKKMNKIKVKGERLKVKGLLILCLLSIFNFLFSICQAQSDSVLNRTITVERDFQPVIQAAGKVSTKPAIVETTIEPATAEYSDYTVEVQPEATFHPLLSQPTRFESTPPYNGYIRGALGHPNTLFDFGYHLDDGKRSILDIFAHHRAEWGLATLSKTKLGFDFSHPFSSCTLFFGLNGGNVFYHKYGHFYDYAAYTATIRDFGMWEKNSIAYPKPYTIKDLDKTSLWTMEAFVGVKANPKQDFQYCFQTGYMLFSKPGAISEHQIRTHANIDWHAEEHHVGINIYAQNNILQLTGLADYIPDSLYGNCHDIRLEPFYAYEGRRFRIHLGVNLDMNIGSGHNSLSSVEHLSFAPSPNIHMEAQIAKQWLTIYADIEGHHGSGSLQEYMEDNRYKLIHHGVLDHQFESYTPIDAELGFHIRPYRDLLLEIHGGYAYMINETNLFASTDTIFYKPLNKKLFLPGDFDYFYADMQRGKIGGQINYHLQDKLRINLAGDYYFWNSDTTVYDRPDWEVALRIDGRIDKHWSLYSDNHFAGNRLALAYDGKSYTEHHLRPTVDLNLGVEYAMWVGKAKSQELKANSHTLRPEPKPNLTLFFQLNNWLHRKNEVYYGYRSQGINFLLGATFRF